VLGENIDNEIVYIIVTPGKSSAANSELEEKAVPATTVAKFSSHFAKDQCLTGRGSPTC
jgi:hypothetical protein